MTESKNSAQKNTQKKTKRINQNIYIITFGCSLNASDSEVMSGILQKQGFKIINDLKKADVIIVNSCTVKHSTETHFWKLLRQLSACKKKVVITGCIAQTDPEKLEGYSLVGTTQLNHIVDAVIETFKNHIVKYIKRSKTTPRLNLPKIRKNHLVEIIPISQGCLGTCTYCKTKAARFDLISYDIDEIVCQARDAVKDGVKEIWLTSQDTAVYGFDRNLSLVDLLKELIRIEGRFRIRIGMGNPEHFASIIDKLLPLFESSKLFRFLHIPVQSGNDAILKLMNRKYKVADFKRLIKKIRAAYPDMTISTDMIVGFPTENDKQFHDSLRLIEEIKPDVLNMSRYSARPKTIAARMPQLQGGIIKDRSRMLAEVFYDVAVDQHKRWLGWKGEIIIDEEGKEGTGTFVGRNYAYKPVIVRKTKNLKIGDIMTMKITETTRNDLRGKNI